MAAPRALGLGSAQAAVAEVADSGSSRGTEGAVVGEGTGALRPRLACGRKQCLGRVPGACPVRACLACMECVSVTPACTPWPSPGPPVPAAQVHTLGPFGLSRQSGSTGPLAVPQAAPMSLTP